MGRIEIDYMKKLAIKVCPWVLGIGILWFLSRLNHDGIFSLHGEFGNLFIILAIPTILVIIVLLISFYIEFVKFLTSKIFHTPFKWTFHNSFEFTDKSASIAAVLILFFVVFLFCVENDNMQRLSEYRKLQVEYSSLKDDYQDLQHYYENLGDEYQNTLDYLQDEWGYCAYSDNPPVCCICGGTAPSFFYNEKTDEYFCIHAVASAFESPYFCNTLSNFIKNN